MLINFHLPSLNQITMFFLSAQERRQSSFQSLKIKQGRNEPKHVSMNLKRKQFPQGNTSGTLVACTQQNKQEA